MSWQARTCRDCGRGFEGRPGTLICPDCWDLRILRVRDARAAARARAVARSRVRGGSPGRFRIRSNFLHATLSWGSCETREEAFFEAGRILAGFPEVSRVAVEEIARYEISRDGLEAGEGIEPDPRAARLALEAVA